MSSNFILLLISFPKSIMNTFKTCPCIMIKPIDLKTSGELKNSQYLPYLSHFGSKQEGNYIVVFLRLERNIKSAGILCRFLLENKMRFCSDLYSEMKEFYAYVGYFYSSIASAFLARCSLSSFIKRLGASSSESHDCSWPF